MMTFSVPLQYHIPLPARSPMLLRAGAGSDKALVERFGEEDIKAAFGLLVRQGLVNPGGSKSRALQLSDRFKTELQVRGCLLS
jgi:hypothetical protein